VLHIFVFVQFYIWGNSQIAPQISSRCLLPVVLLLTCCKTYGVMLKWIICPTVRHCSTYFCSVLTGLAHMLFQICNIFMFVPSVQCIWLFQVDHITKTDTMKPTHLLTLFVCVGMYVSALCSSVLYYKHPVCIMRTDSIWSQVYMHRILIAFKSHLHRIPHLNHIYPTSLWAIKNSFKSDMYFSESLELHELELTNVWQATPCCRCEQLVNMCFYIVTGEMVVLPRTRYI
jgi:hypothetical protein